MNWFFEALRALSPNCKEAIRLQSKALDHSLPFLQRMGLRLHAALCIWCWRYARHVLFLRTVAPRCDREQKAGPALPPETWERMKQVQKNADR
jgi:hypothetical protein